MGMKGLSPMISTILLVALATTVAAILVPWVMDFAKTQTNTITNQGEKKVNCIESGLYFTSSDIGYDSLSNPARINVSIKNSGLVDLYTFKMQFKLSGAYSSLYDPMPNLFNASNPVVAGQKVTLNASIPQLTGTLQAVRVIARNCDLGVEVNV